MIIGCVFVKPLITSPNPNVINLVYGKINNPSNPATAPPTIGNTIIFKLPSLLPINKIMPTAMEAVIIVLIKSPMPTMTHLLSTNVDAPDPTKAAAPVTAVCNCVKPNCAAINIPVKIGIEY